MKNKLFIFILLWVVLIMFAACNELGDGLFARIETSRGEIIVKLEYEKTPLTVCNFIALAEGGMESQKGKRFYDGLKFHRVISVANGDGQDFMIQGGCPEGTGRGNPGYQFPDEFDSSLKHDRPGVLSMANSGPNTNGSQFFITIVPTPHLDGRHTVFGYVVKGQDIVNSTVQGDVIKKVTIVRNGKKAKSFEANQENFNRLLSEMTAEADKKNQEKLQEDIKTINHIYPDTQMTSSGIRYIIQQRGSGAKPVSGNNVSVHYTGKLLDGTVFDDSTARGEPLKFPVGTGRVIKGWDETVLDMQKGEKRLVVIPPELAYGSRVMGGGAIPANSFLVFEMELISFE